MNKIICIIEDTGERRHPVQGEKWISDYSFSEGLKSGDIASSVYSAAIATQHYDPQHCMIVTETIVNAVPDSLVLKERVELLNLRRFRDGVMGAANLYGRTSAVTDIALLQAEVRALGEKLDIAGRELYCASMHLDPPCSSAPPKPSGMIFSGGCLVAATEKGFEVATAESASPQDVAEKQAEWAKQCADSDAKEAASTYIHSSDCAARGGDATCDCNSIGALGGIPMAKARGYDKSPFLSGGIVIDPFKTEEEA